MGVANAYCLCQVPMKQQARVQTQVARETADPVWNREAEVPDFAAGDSLTFTVYDKDAGSGGGDGFLGSARLQHSEIQAAFDGELQLSGAAGNAAHLRVRINSDKRIGGPAPAASRRIPLAVPSGTGRSAPLLPAPAGFGNKVLEPRPEALKFEDPRSARKKEVGVIAFDMAGKEAWDEFCGGAFLGSHFDLGPGGLPLEIPLEPGRRKTFSNAEAAFQALHFWPLAADFAEVSGEQAVRKRQQLRGKEDPNRGGFLSDWKSMQAVLGAKFRPGTPMASALSRTRDAFLLEHRAVSGGDTVWSNDGNGEGKNWLGLQLMILRDKLSGAHSWTGYLEGLFDLSSGQPLSASHAQRWQDAVRKATNAVVHKFGRSHAPAQGPPAVAEGDVGAGVSRFLTSDLGPSLSVPQRPGSGPGGKAQQWAAALALLSAERQGNASPFGSGFGGGSLKAFPSALPDKLAPFAPSAGKQWSNALGVWQQWQPPRSGATFPSTLSQQWSNALGLLQQQQRQAWPPSQGFANSPPWKAYPNGSQQWSNALSLLDRGGWASARPAQAPLLQSAPPWGAPTGWGGAAGGNNSWSQALGMLDNPWGQQQQQQQMVPWRGGAPPPPSSTQLSPDMLAILPEAVSNMSETASQHSQASSELSHVHAARALYKACQDGDINEVRRVLNEGLVNPDCRNPKGATPLFAAAFANHTQVVKLLLEHQADADRTNNDSATPAFIAAQRDSSAALGLLLRAKADPDRSRKDRATPTFIAAANCSGASLELLLRARADPNLANKNGDTPLTIAAYSSHVQSVHLLVSARADVHQLGYRGQENALDCATRAEASAGSSDAAARARTVAHLLRAAGAAPLAPKPGAGR